MIFILSLANPWIIRILQFQPLNAVVIVLSTVVLYKSIRSKKTSRLAILLFALLAFIQITNTRSTFPVVLTEKETVLINQRLKEYPPIYFLPIAHWLEERPESIIFSKVLNNISEAVNPNMYFFANHPVSRLGFYEFEKFPYILFPFFLAGLFFLVDKNRNMLLLTLLLPILLFAIIGTDSELGPFLLFPGILVVSLYGLNLLLKNKFVYSLFTLLYLIVFFKISLL